MPARSQLNVDGTPVAVSNLDKVFYPQTGFSKGDMINYYVQISPVLLPHLKKRPVTLKRYPDGVEGFFFYEKECPSHRPDWVKTLDVPREKGGEIHYCVIDTLPALVWAANLADLELHTFLHQLPDRPTCLAFDLDPGPPAGLLECCQVALWLRDLFAGLQMACFPKTSGSKGLQVFVPLNTAVTYAETKTFARAVAETLTKEFPQTVVAKMPKNLRAGKVLVDWSQNDAHKTTVCAYSLRAMPRPLVSAPLAWDEVGGAVKKKNAKALVCDAETVLARVKRNGDLFASVLELKQKLPRAKSLHV